MPQKERTFSMQSTVQGGMTCWLLEFRSPDRPISVPTRFPEAAGLSSDKLSTTGMSAPENVLTHLDKELGQTLRRSEPGRRGPPEKTHDQREE